MISCAALVSFTGSCESGFWGVLRNRLYSRSDAALTEPHKIPREGCGSRPFGNDPSRKVIGTPSPRQSIPRPRHSPVSDTRHLDAPATVLLTGLRGRRMISAGASAHTPIIVYMVSSLAD